MEYPYRRARTVWISKLQSEVALSTTEAEFIALSNSLRDIIPISTLLNEISAALKLDLTIPQLTCIHNTEIIVERHLTHQQLSLLIFDRSVVPCFKPCLDLDLPAGMITSL